MTKMRRAGRPAYRLSRYPQVQRTFYDETTGLPSNQVHHLAQAVDGTVWAGTDLGIARFDGKEWEVPAEVDAPPKAQVTALFADSKGRVWVGIESSIYCLDAGTWSATQLNASPRALAIDPTGKLWLATDSELLWLDDSNQWRRYVAMGHFEIRGMAALPDNRVFLATNEGLQALGGKRPLWFELIPERTGIPTLDVRDVYADESGHLWVATAEGAAIFDTRSEWFVIRGEQGLPIEDVHAVTGGPAGDRWFGTSVGVARLLDGQWKYYAGERWLPGDRVSAVALAPDGTVWVATESGVSRLVTREMTLADKAEHYDALIQRYHTRMGYVTVMNLAEKGNLDSGRVEISDNDGLWTAHYIVSQAYQYAVTGDEGAKERAKRSMEALLKLTEITGIKGFPARAIRHKSEPEFGAPYGEWAEFYRTPDGEWEWKGETSSDEMVGHFYAYSVYYDLIADKEEKARIADTVRAITDHIIENGFRLVDIDGKPTTWACWAPEALNGEDTWWAEKGCNSLEILSFLKVAFHITGDPRYEQVYRELINKHHYAMNTLEQKITLPAGRINHIDDQLAFLSYLPLLTYETDPALRVLYMMSLEHHWQHERPERTPLWNIIYGALTGREWDAEGAVKRLVELPLDLTHWPVKNSHRADIEIDQRVAAHGVKQATEPVAWDERPMHRYSGNPYTLDGGNGHRVEDGCIFLHPYWLARYHGLIEEA